MSNKLSKIDKDYIYEEFDSSTILDAVDAVDKVRSIFADKANNATGENAKRISSK